MMELGACVSLLGECPPLRHDRVQQVKIKVARLAKVTGGRDCKTFSLASNGSRSHENTSPTFNQFRFKRRCVKHRPNKPR